MEKECSQLSPRILSAQKLFFRYRLGERDVLHGLSFAIERGGFYGLVGANKAGKSTLCLLLSGIAQKFQDGNVSGDLFWYEGEEKSPLSMNQKIGLVLQLPSSQLSGMCYTVFEEVAFSLENRGIDRTEMERRVKEVLAEVDLLEYGGCSPYALSGGQQQRLAIASVLVGNPELLILDEPTTFLSPMAQRALFSLLKKIQQGGTTVIIAEQRMELLAEYCTQLLVLENGVLVGQGRPQQIFSSWLGGQGEKTCLRPSPYTELAYSAQQRGYWRGDLLATTFQEMVDGLAEVRAELKAGKVET